MSAVWETRRYEPADAARWNEFVRDSRNATFLFDRRYMDYHADRFCDCSWMAYKNGKLRALLPADITPDGTLRSHGGLSYGGWVLPPSHVDGTDVLELFECAAARWHEEGILRLDYKPLPYIYASRPSEEDLYALFRLGATTTEITISATIDMRNPGGFNQLQRRHLSKANALPIRIGEAECGEFMHMLAECLRERHDTIPVHNENEMRLLLERFPENIRLYGVYLNDRLHAGTCIYDTGLVAHAQYIATTPEGRRLNLLAPLFSYLIDTRYRSRRYFDFGISTEDHGQVLNSGLLRQKYSYGATATVCRRLMLSL